MKKTVLLLSLGVFLAVSCAKKEQEVQALNVSFTPCQQTKSTKSEVSGKVDVEFTKEDVKITYCNFEITCDFTTVNVAHTFVNGVLNITQQGTPNQADCMCYTDVSYTISGISQYKVKVIFINGVQVYCHNDNDSTEKLDTIIVLKKKEFFITTNSNNTMAVSFVEVTDNRCAKSQCHLCWGSKADILLSITDSEKRDIEIDLSIVGCIAYDDYADYISAGSVDTLGYRFQLIRLSPYPDIEPINKDDYIAKIKISKL